MQEPTTARVGTAASAVQRAQRAVLAALAILFSTPLLAASDCLPIREASHHVGETKCVTSRVVRVKVGATGVHYVDFCEDQMACPFTVVVFPSDLKDVGDVRRLAGHLIEIRGPVKLYDGRAAIILSGSQPVDRRLNPDPAPAQELRRGKARPLQRRKNAANQKASENQSHARYHGNLRQRG
jgi:hypothetical protein